MSIPTSRRAMLAGAATLSAASAVNLAAIVATRAAHVDRSDDAELIALGEEMKPHIVNAFRLEQVSHRLYEKTEQLAGPIPEGADTVYWQWRERWDRFNEETGYGAAAARWNEALAPIYELAERALDLPATTLAGYRVQAMAILATESDNLEDNTPWADFLWTLAREAGYPAEADPSAVQS